MVLQTIPYKNVLQHCKPNYPYQIILDIMHDLDWIEEEKICIIIFAEKLLLQNEENAKDDFLEILETSSLENLSVVYLSN
jgi:hypothetical protein